MKVQLCQWGNSVGVRVPAVALADVGMHVGQTLEMRTEGKRLVLEAAAETLEELIAKITPENRHGLALEDDASRGVEIW
jgi:antitoxin MazE